jgi:hypothetical protein
MENPQIGAEAPLVRWLGRWVTEGERASQKAAQPRVEVPLVMPEPEPEVIMLHLWARPNLYEWS